MDGRRCTDKIRRASYMTTSSSSFRASALLADRLMIARFGDNALKVKTVVAAS